MLFILVAIFSRNSSQFKICPKDPLKRGMVYSRKMGFIVFTYNECLKMKIFGSNSYKTNPIQKEGGRRLQQRVIPVLLTWQLFFIKQFTLVLWTKTWNSCHLLIPVFDISAFGTSFCLWFVTLLLNSHWVLMWILLNIFLWELGHIL